MTNEKAIERLTAFRDYLCGGNPIWDVDECKEAFDIALAAMSERNLDEWCDNCKEYDHDRHCCHRFNRVIRKTVEDLQGVKQNAEQKWIPVSEKPNKRERYIVTAKLMGGFMDGYTSIEIARWNGYYWEIEDVMSDYKVTAYMPLPDPWRGEEG